MKIRSLITRPHSKGQLLAAEIEAAGGQAICCPFIEVISGTQLSLAPQYLNELTAQDYVIAISDNAVNYTTQSLNQLNCSWPQTLNYIAVGPNTANSWQQAGVMSVLIPSSHDTEGVLALLNDLDLTASRIIILRGNGGRETLAEALAQRSKNVTYCEVYQRIKPNYDSNKLVDNWQQFAINSVIITSGEILTNLMQSIPSHASSWITNLYFIVPSQRIAKLAYQFGINHVTVAQGASNNAILAALEQLDMQIGIS